MVFGAREQKKRSDVSVGPDCPEQKLLTVKNVSELEHKMKYKTFYGKSSIL